MPKPYSTFDNKDMQNNNQPSHINLFPSSFFPFLFVFPFSYVPLSEMKQPPNQFVSESIICLPPTPPSGDKAVLSPAVFILSSVHRQGHHPSVVAKKLVELQESKKQRLQVQTEQNVSMVSVNYQKQLTSA